MYRGFNCSHMLITGPSCLVNPETHPRTYKDNQSVVFLWHVSSYLALSTIISFRRSLTTFSFFSLRCHLIKVCFFGFFMNNLPIHLGLDKEHVRIQHGDTPCVCTRSNIRLKLVPGTSTSLPAPAASFCFCSSTLDIQKTIERLFGVELKK